jgi:hypothetical protein
MDPIDLLLDELVKDGRWPPKREVLIHAEVRTYRAFLESDRPRLKTVAGWGDDDRDYKIDPLAELIADAWADHLFGEELVVRPANERDAKALEFMLEETGDLTADAHDAERHVVGEGEYWWRVLKDEDVADVPLLDWHPRDHVVPLYVGAGRRLLAAALVTELPKKGRSSAVYRHFEIHADEVVEHVLFRGTKARIGQTVPLGEHPDLEDLDAILPGAGTTEARVWPHGLPMLMGRILNGRRINRKLNIGVSDFYRVADYLLDLNEAATIGAENARLTAKRRVVVTEDALQRQSPELVDNGDGSFRRVPRPGFDAGEDVLVVSRLDAELGQSPDSTFKVLEYSFDAEALIAYKRDLVETALTRVGITPQYVGIIADQGDGFALSGTALRLRLIPTTKAGHGKARPWDHGQPHALSLMAQLDALSVAEGGFGRTWAAADLPPSVERHNPLPHDEVEDAQVDSQLVSAGLQSRFTTIKSRHDDWTDEQVKQELERIDAERPSTAAAFNPNLA